MHDFVECPLCNKKFKIITVNHLKRFHNMSLEDFQTQYTGFEMECEDVKRKRSENTKRAVNTPERQKVRSENTKKQHMSGNLNPSKTSKEMWKRNRDKIIESMREAQKRPEVVRRKSEIMLQRRLEDRDYQKRLLTNEEVRKQKISIASKKMWEREEHRDKIMRYFENDSWINEHYKKSGREFISKKYGSFRVRSSYEYRVCEMLEDLEIRYDYEKHKYRYSFNGSTHTYRVDFYLPDLDLFLEVKPKIFQNDPKNLAKVNSVKDRGLNIIFIGEDEVFNVNNFYDKLITSTTIRKP